MTDDDPRPGTDPDSLPTVRAAPVQPAPPPAPTISGSPPATTETFPAARARGVVEDAIPRHTGSRNPAENYFPLRKLGAGGFGQVWLYRYLGRLEAWKIFFNPRASAPEINAGRVEHPNVIRFYDHIIKGNRLVARMEFVDGVDLESLVGSHRVRTSVEAAEICRQVADALDHGHRNNVLHLDVKPSNVLIDGRSGAAKLIDYGVSQLKDESQLPLGESRSYSAPDLYDGLDQRADVYSLGATMHFLLSGRPPGPGGKVFAPEQAPFAAPELRSLIERLVAPEKANRVQTMAEVGAALQAFVDGVACPRCGDPLVRAACSSGHDVPAAVRIESLRRTIEQHVLAGEFDEATDLLESACIRDAIETDDVERLGVQVRAASDEVRDRAARIRALIHGRDPCSAARRVEDAPSYLRAVPDLVAAANELDGSIVRAADDGVAEAQGLVREGQFADAQANLVAIEAVLNDPPARRRLEARLLRDARKDVIARQGVLHGEEPAAELDPFAIVENRLAEWRQRVTTEREIVAREQQEYEHLVAETERAVARFDLRTAYERLTHLPRVLASERERVLAALTSQIAEVIRLHDSGRLVAIAKSPLEGVGTEGKLQVREWIEDCRSVLDRFRASRFRAQAKSWLGKLAAAQTQLEKIRDELWTYYQEQSARLDSSRGSRAQLRVLGRLRVIATRTDVISEDNEREDIKRRFDRLDRSRQELDVLRKSVREHLSHKKRDVEQALSTLTLMADQFSNWDDRLPRACQKVAAVDRRMKDMIAECERVQRQKDAPPAARVHKVLGNLGRPPTAFAPSRYGGSWERLLQASRQVLLRHLRDDGIRDAEDLRRLVEATLGSVWTALLDPRVASDEPGVKSTARSLVDLMSRALVRVVDVDLDRAKVLAGDERIGCLEDEFLRPVLLACSAAETGHPAVVIAEGLVDWALGRSPDQCRKLLRAAPALVERLRVTGDDRVKVPFDAVRASIAAAQRRGLIGSWSTGLWTLGRRSAIPVATSVLLTAGLWYFGDRAVRADERSLTLAEIVDPLRLSTPWDRWLTASGAATLRPRTELALAWKRSEPDQSTDPDRDPLDVVQRARALANAWSAWRAVEPLAEAPVDEAALNTLCRDTAERAVEAHLRRRAGREGRTFSPGARAELELVFGPVCECVRASLWNSDTAEQVVSELGEIEARVARWIAQLQTPPFDAVDLADTRGAIDDVPAVTPGRDALQLHLRRIVALVLIARLTDQLHEAQRGVLGPFLPASRDVLEQLSALHVEPDALDIEDDIVRAACASLLGTPRAPDR